LIGDGLLVTRRGESFGLVERQRAAWEVNERLDTRGAVATARRFGVSLGTVLAAVGGDA
jgi:hypothetical protein